MTHSVSVVFTCRTICSREGWSRHFSSSSGLEGRSMYASPFLTSTLPSLTSPTLMKMPDGRQYEDFYQVPY